MRASFNQRKWMNPDTKLPANDPSFCGFWCDATAALLAAHDGVLNMTLEGMSDPALFESLSVDNIERQFSAAVSTN
jgi:hypothetical protein